MWVQLQQQGGDGEHGSDSLCSVIPPGPVCFYICWWSHVASCPRWSRLLYLQGVPTMQITMARCDSSTITAHEGIPISVLRMKNQWHNLLMSNIWLASRDISLFLAADFCCFTLQTAGIEGRGMMLLKWVLPQCSFYLCQSPGQPGLE